jgi:hypothetical protein
MFVVMQLLTGSFFNLVRIVFLLSDASAPVNQHPDASTPEPAPGC